MKVYISGPITGHEGFMDRFKAAELKLKEQGVDVINPAEMNSYLPENTTHEEYMAVSLVLEGMCDCIYMLEGWRESKGATIEFEYAIEHGITIAFEKGERSWMK